jgi:hypothetical protein
MVYILSCESVPPFIAWQYCDRRWPLLWLSVRDAGVLQPLGQEMMQGCAVVTEGCIHHEIEWGGITRVVFSVIMDKCCKGKMLNPCFRVSSAIDPKIGF